MELLLRAFDAVLVFSPTMNLLVFVTALFVFWLAAGLILCGISKLIRLTRQKLRRGRRTTRRYIKWA